MNFGENISGGCSKRWLWVLILSYLVYAGLYIWHTSYVVEGVRYFSLFDDTMISMRYADNIARGHGPFWNPGGEAVEGFSNPLWVYFMSLLHLTGLAKEKMSLLVQFVCAIFMAFSIVFICKTAQQLLKNSAAAFAAAFFTAFYFPLQTWNLQGVEVSGITLILCAWAWLTVKSKKAGKAGPLIFILPPIMILIRLDMALAATACIAIAAIYIKTNVRFIIAGGIISLALATGLHLGYNLLYFGDIYPNTYYLKITGYPVLGRIGQGLLSVGKHILFLNPLLILIAFIFAFREKQLLLKAFLVLYLIQLAYNIYVGGDAWRWWSASNRFISPALPLFFIPLAGGLYEAAKRITPAAKKTSAKWVFGFIVLLSILVMNSFDGPASLREVFLLEPAFSRDNNITNTKMARHFDRISDEQARIAVVTAGVMPYFLERRFIDMLGKNDERIARQKAKMLYPDDIVKSFSPGHNKWDYSYSIGALKPDIVTQLWKNPEEAEPYLKGYRRVRWQGFDFYVKEGSPHIKWDKINSGR